MIPWDSLERLARRAEVADRDPRPTSNAASIFREFHPSGPPPGPPRSARFSDPKSRRRGRAGFFNSLLGSASLLVSFPELGHPEAPLASTYDADLCPLPFDEVTGRMLEQALGESQAYYQRHGYHADILRDSIFETLPDSWRDRLIEVPDTPKAKALDPHDLAAVKLLVGRPKDTALVKQLLHSKRLDPDTLQQRIGAFPIPVESLPKVLANFRNASS